MNKNNYCIIMAGGIGSRFWPLSRVNKPKQFVDILGIGKTFIQMTYERFSSFIPKENFIVVTGKIYKDLVLEQLPQITEQQVLLEPARRNTAPCLAYAAYKIKSQNPEAVMVVTPADHLVIDTLEFARVIENNLQYAANHPNLLTIGIQPTFPSTGYGYIEMDNAAEDFGKVKSFKEKPDFETATQFIQKGRFLWNSGMFIWSAKAITEAMEKYSSKIASDFQNLSDSYYSSNEQQMVDKTYMECESISIDYAIMEKADNVYVTKADFGWSDLGTWTSLYEHGEKDEKDNLIKAENSVVTDTRNTFIKELNNNKLVVVDGVENLLVVDTDDALFISQREDEGRVKRVIEKATGEFRNFS